LLLKQEGVHMFSVDLSTRKSGGPVVVALRGELDVVDAASVVARLSVMAAHGRVVVVDLAGLEFIDSSGIAALVRVRRNARHAGGDLLLAAPQAPVLRVLTVTRLIDTFSVHDGVAEAVGTVARPRARWSGRQRRRPRALPIAARARLSAICTRIVSGKFA
jgi:anti-sigma B factor antagonist